MKTLLLSVAAWATATAAMANDPVLCASMPNAQGCTPVPEISALEGTAAMATLAAIMLLAWERRRRAS